MAAYLLDAQRGTAVPPSGWQPVAHLGWLVAPKASGASSVTGPVLPMAAKKLATSSLPCLGPYHGAFWIAAPADQSMSSVTRSRMAWTSPRRTGRRRRSSDPQSPLNLHGQAWLHRPGRTRRT